jgi:predicted nuclease of predicted toxin-antitoxin system
MAPQQQLRFYLDHDVDARCRRVLEKEGHHCWTASQAGRGEAGDDDQTVYATDRDAVVITHDREFTERRKKNSIGRHVRLMCEQPEGPELLERHLPSIVSLAAAIEHVTIEVQHTKVTHYVDWQ